MRKPRQTAAALAREMHAADPSLTTSQIAAALSERLKRKIVHQQVQDALHAQSSKPGPRARHAKPARLMATVSAETLERVQAEAEAAGVSLSEWVERKLSA